MKQQALYQKADTLILNVFSANRPVIPTSATITLYKTDGNGVLQAAATASVDATTGQMSYSLTTTHTATLGLNYKAVWAYIVNGTTYYETQLWDVVRSKLSIPITDDDLYAELPSLRKANLQDRGTATAGSSSTLTDTLKRKEVDDYWKGGKLEIYSGTGSGQTRDITGFVQSTAVISVTPNFVTTPDTTSLYRVVKSFADAIQNGFDKIENMLYNKGQRDSLILEASQIRIPLIYLVLHTICMDFREEKDDRWDILQAEYKDKFNEAFNTLTLDYDADESGGVQGEEQQAAINTIRILRS